MLLIRSGCCHFQANLHLEAEKTTLIYKNSQLKRANERFMTSIQNASCDCGGLKKILAELKPPVSDVCRRIEKNTVKEELMTKPEVEPINVAHSQHKTMTTTNSIMINNSVSVLRAVPVNHEAVTVPSDTSLMLSAPGRTMPRKRTAHDDEMSVVRTGEESATDCMSPAEKRANNLNNSDYRSFALVRKAAPNHTASYPPVHITAQPVVSSAQHNTLIESQQLPTTISLFAADDPQMDNIIVLDQQSYQPL